MATLDIPDPAPQAPGESWRDFVDRVYAEWVVPRRAAADAARKAYIASLSPEQKAYNAWVSRRVREDNAGLDRSARPGMRTYAWITARGD